MRLLLMNEKQCAKNWRCGHFLAVGPNGLARRDTPLLAVPNLKVSFCAGISDRIYLAHITARLSQNQSELPSSFKPLLEKNRSAYGSAKFSNK